MHIYCPQLGMLVFLSYCMRVQNNLPCSNTYGCWKERVDVTAVLKANFTDEEIALAFNTIPKSRLQKIMESASAARRDT